jgi:hypothetical protein
LESSQVIGDSVVHSDIGGESGKNVVWKDKRNHGVEGIAEEHASHVVEARLRRARNRAKQKRGVPEMDETGVVVKGESQGRRGNLRESEGQILGSIAGPSVNPIGNSVGVRTRRVGIETRVGEKMMESFVGHGPNAVRTMDEAKV